MTPAEVLAMRDRLAEWLMIEREREAIIRHCGSVDLIRLGDERTRGEERMSEKMTVEKVAEDAISSLMFAYADAAVSDDFYAEWGEGGEEDSREVILLQYDVDFPGEKVIGKFRVTVNVEEVDE